MSKKERKFYCNKLDKANDMLDLKWKDSLCVALVTCFDTIFPLDNIIRKMVA